MLVIVEISLAFFTVSIIYIVFGLLLAAIRIAMLKLGFPEALYTTELFSPSIYAHTSYIPSLGDLLLHAALLAAYFYGLYAQVKSDLKLEKTNYKILLGLNVAFALLTVLCINVIISLVNDSKINVNVNNLISLNFTGNLHLLLHLLFQVD